MLIIRNPWGSTTYTGDWNHNDENWTQELIDQIPAGLNPHTSLQEGIFFVEKSILERPCFNRFSISHFRDNQGYYDDWYDALDMDEETHFYYFTLPESTSTFDHIYLTVETYYKGIIPSECTTDWWNEDIELPAPVVNFKLNANSGSDSYNDQIETIETKFYVDVTHDPIMTDDSDLEGGQTY